MRILVLSPHLDDAVLSAGASLSEGVLEGHAIEVYTLFAGIACPPFSPIALAFHDACGLGHDATSARRDEDLAAMMAIGASAHHGPFLDAVYRQRADGTWLCAHEDGMFDPAWPAEPALLSSLETAIRCRCEVFRPTMIATCFALGSHVDHRLTHTAALRVSQLLQVPLLLWEDLPYAVGDPLREAPDPAIMLRARPEAWHRKRQAIRCYPSQIRMLWPVEADWWDILWHHATIRGGDAPAELAWLKGPVA